MEKKKLDSDDYWSTTNSGFDFSSNDFQTPHSDSKLSATLRNDELNQPDLLRRDGLAEVVENRVTEDFLPFFISQGKNEKYASQLAKNANPLIINQKRLKKNVRLRPEETVKNMILGSEYSLNEYRGKMQKTDLLNAAVRSHDGNTILEIVLFMRDTLKKSIFQREIVQCLDAVNVYLAYLEEDHEIDELTNMLSLLKRPEDAAILKYQAAVAVQDPQTKLKWIGNCLSTHFQTEASDTFFYQSVVEHQKLLEEHIKLQIYDTNNHAHEIDKNILLFEKLTGKKTVIDSSVLCSLIFCCLYYHAGGELNIQGAETLKNNYKMSRKQYTWGIIRALAASQRWMDIDYLFISKNWLGGVKVQSSIHFSRIIEVLFKAKAPIEVLKKYVSFVDNEDEKLMLAKKYACHAVVIEVYKNNKDRVALKNYLAALLPNSVDFYTAIEVLKNPAIRWKN